MEDGVVDGVEEVEVESVESEVWIESMVDAMERVVVVKGVGGGGVGRGGGGCGGVAVDSDRWNSSHRETIGISRGGGRRKGWTSVCGLR